MFWMRPGILACTVLFFFSTQGYGQEEAAEEEKTVTVSLAENKLTMEVPEGWNQVEPRYNMIDSEFSLPKKGEDENNGRMTVMGAGGSIQQNIDRWIGQFSQPDGSSSEDVAKTEEKEIGGMTIHTLDISGTYADSAGPRSPTTYRADYRMLAAIIQTNGHGNYFVKLYGGKATIDENAKRFKKMIESVKKKE